MLNSITVNHSELIMTAQIPDKFVFKGEAFDLIGMEGTIPFNPLDYGMQPIPISTACWRGFHCTFEITEENITLKELTIRVQNDAYKPVNCIMPTTGQYGDSVYSDVGLVIPFAGTLRLANGFISERYVHMGYQKPSAYMRVYDVSFENGLVISVADRSAEVADIRDNPGSKNQTTEEFIDKSFTLDMDLE